MSERSRPSSGGVLTVQTWRLELTGQPRLCSAGRRSIELERRDAALLCVLALDGAIARTRAMELLWPDEDDAVLRNRLRQRLFALKRKLGTEAAQGTTNLTLGANIEWTGLDIGTDDKPLLGEDRYSDLPEFSQWLQAQRTRVVGLRRDRLQTLVATLENEGRIPEAIVAAQQLLALEPLHEHAHQRLMRLHYLSGDRAAALLAFDHCEQLLKQEVGARPSKETLALLDQIERSEALSTVRARRGVPAAVLRPPRLIGRDAQWANLQAICERHRSIVLIGEPGVGKTRLLADLATVHGAAQGHVVAVSARPGDDRVPYALLSRLLRALLSRPDQPRPAAPIAAELARLLPEFGLAPSDTSETEHARLVNAVESLLQDACGNGLQIVVLDDLHFSDGASVEMAQHLTGFPNLRWWLAFRGAEVGPQIQSWVDKLTAALQAEAISLEPLNEDQVGALLASLGLDGFDDPQLAARMHRRTGGNPMYVLETVKAMLAQDATSGDLQPSGGLEPMRMPQLPNIGRLIERRLAQLSADAVRLARCAAIAGQDFTAALAAQVLGVRTLDLADAWIELEAAQVLRDGAFVHDLIYEAAAASVPKVIAAQLHLEIARCLVDSQVDPRRVAAHWIAGGAHAQACVALRAAASRAQSALRPREAVECLIQAALLSEQAGDFEAAWADSLAACKTEVSGATDLTRQAIAVAERIASTPTQKAVVLEARANLAWVEHRLDQLESAAREMLELAEHHGFEDYVVSARQHLATLMTVAGDNDAAVLMMMRNLAWTQTHGTENERAVFFANLAVALDNADRSVEASSYHELAVAAARQGNSIREWVNTLCNRAVSLADLGSVQQAAKLVVESDRLRASSDLPMHSVLNISLLQSHLAHVLGRYDDALHWANESHELLRELSPGWVAIPELRRVRIWLQLGQLARARSAVQSIVLDELPDWVRAQHAWLEARVSRALGQAPDAALKRAMTHVPRRGRLVMRHCIQLELSRALDDAQAAPQVLAVLDEARSRGYRSMVQEACVEVLRRRNEPHFAAQAHACLQELADLGETTDSLETYRPEVWLVQFQTWHEWGCPDLAQIPLRAALEWIEQATLNHIPDEFRASFLQRNPTNRQLVSAAQSLGLFGPTTSLGRLLARAG